MDRILKIGLVLGLLLVLSIRPAQAYTIPIFSSDGGQVASATTSQGIGGQVLVLASTGNRWQSYVLMLVGITSLLAAFTGRDKKL